MKDLHDRPTPPRRLAADAHEVMALYLAGRSQRSEAAVILNSSPFSGEVRHHRGALYVQMGDDALAGHGTGPVAPNNWLAWAFAAPVVMTLAYGGTRIVMGLLTQWRDGIFAKVAMNAVRRLAMLTFEHVHLLSLRFHLERKTGGLTRVLERGRDAIETIVRMVLLQIAPTVVELVLIVAVLLVHFDWRYVAIIGATVAVYMWFTYAATQWLDQHPPQDERERQRRQRQGDRSAAQLRDRQIFLGGDPRSPNATTARWRGTRMPASKLMCRSRCSMPVRR